MPTLCALHAAVGCERRPRPPRPIRIREDSNNARGGRKIAQVLRAGEVASAITEWLNDSVRFLRAIELPGLLESSDL
jgi:hypothetical protein